MGRRRGAERARQRLRLNRYLGLEGGGTDGWTDGTERRNYRWQSEESTLTLKHWSKDGACLVLSVTLCWQCSGRETKPFRGRGRQTRGRRSTGGRIELNCRVKERTARVDAARGADHYQSIGGRTTAAASTGAAATTNDDERRREGRDASKEKGKEKTEDKM
jgi:hypothetical protein